MKELLKILFGLFYTTFHVVLGWALYVLFPMIVSWRLSFWAGFIVLFLLWHLGHLIIGFAAYPYIILKGDEVSLRTSLITSEIGTWFMIFVPSICIAINSPSIWATIVFIILSIWWMLKTAYQRAQCLTMLLM